MKLIVKDPHCSGLQVYDCKDEKSIKKVLSKNGYNEEDGMSGEVVYYVFVDKNGTALSDSLDFT